MTTKDIVNFIRESNAIEGVYGLKPTLQGVSAWDYLIKQNKLTPENIQIMQGIGSEHLLEERFSGKFRKCDVWIGERKGSDWVLIPTLIKSWCDLANNAKTEEEIQHDHIRYERIHPFGDYNGRSGRILMNWQRVKAGLPLLVIKESEKFEYYKWFK